MFGFILPFKKSLGYSSDFERKTWNVIPSRKEQGGGCTWGAVKTEQCARSVAFCINLKVQWSCRFSSQKVKLYCVLVRSSELWLAKVYCILGVTVCWALHKLIEV